jgi:hypothetical protein
MIHGVLFTEEQAAEESGSNEERKNHALSDEVCGTLQERGLFPVGRKNLWRSQVPPIT